MFFVFLLFALFASVFTVGKIGLQYTEPFFLIGSRMLFAGVILLGYELYRQGIHFNIDKQGWRRILRLALFNIYVTNVLEFWGLKYLTSFKTCFIYSLSPFLSAILSYIIFTEKMSIKKWIGLGIGFLGILPMMLSETSLEQETGHLFVFSWAELAVIIAATTSVYGWIILRQLVNENGLSPLLANGLSMIIGGSMSLFHSRLVEDWNPVPVTDFLPFFLCAAWLLIVSNIICYNLYGWLLTRFSATFLSLAGFTTSMFSALFGWVFLSESLTWAFFISSAVILLGLSIFYQEELKPSLAKIEKNPNLASE
jgi:drug/metabolite transporter (DMT)-like permease